MNAKIKLSMCAAALVAVGVTFQNCAPSDSMSKLGSADQSSNDSSGDFEDPGALPDPGAIGSFSKNKCTFTLVGAGGSTWASERYVSDTSDCSLESATVQMNNPRATIRSVVRSYVYDPITTADKLKCAYTLKGSSGSAWISERYIASNDDCEGAELSLVRANNPAAQVMNVESIFVNDSISAIEKTKCSYQLRGAAGAQWSVERYTSATSNCNGETSIAAANNPRATILKVTASFVYDPF